MNDPISRAAAPESDAVSGERTLDPTQASLERFLQATAIAPRPDLADRVRWRLAQEPPSTAPRRFLVALGALDARGVMRALRQSIATAFGPGRRPAVLRMQAMAIVSRSPRLAWGVSLPSLAPARSSRS
jgi:hypothetical protein